MATDWIDLLTTDATGQAQPVQAALAEMGFADPKNAARSLWRIVSDPKRRCEFADLFPHLWTALGDAADPDRVLASFERFIDAASRLDDTCRFLSEHPRVVEILVKIFSASQFLSEILLRNPEYFEDLVDLKRLEQPKSVEQLAGEIRGSLNHEESLPEQMDRLRRFQRREILRIGVCDLLDLFDLPTATRQLSNLADSLVQAALTLAARLDLPPAGFAVIGMGKLGGQELNYSSDIDVLFIASPTSPATLRVCEKLIDILARVTTEGFLYRVDLRLRPWGKVGPLVSSPEGYLAYLEKHALLWEKQALLKARVVAGDRKAGGEFFRRAKPLLFSQPAESVRADVFAMKQRTESALQQKGRMWGDVKLGEGSIRDAEFCIQFLQLAHGKEHPEILSPNSLEALDALVRAGYLTGDERRILADGYIFLRTIEHHLQIMDYRQTHTLPEDPAAIHSLARRLGFKNGEKFLARYRQYAAAIRRVYLRHVGSVDMKKSSLASTAPSPSSPPDIDHHRARMSPSYAETFNEEEIRLHAALAARLDRQTLCAVYGREAEAGLWRVAIIAYDFPGELSLICGLMFVYGMDIVKGEVFTYQSLAEPAKSDWERKIVDVFTVRPTRQTETSEGTWLRYQQDLESLLRMVSSGQAREARGELAKRAGAALFDAARQGQNGFHVDQEEPQTHEPLAPENRPSLTPVEIAFDNDSSERYTLLHIDAPDTIGFLYEFTNALALYRVYIDRVRVDSAGSRVRDTLYVTDENGRKITGRDKQRELRAATVLIKHFTHLLPYSPNPEAALLHFREFIAQLFQRPNWPDELASLERPEVLQALARLLGVSDFLWDDFLRMQYANLYPVVRDVGALQEAKTHAQLQSDLDSILREAHPQPTPLVDDPPWHEALNSFKDREMFRIDMRHILGQTQEFWEFASELTDLAEVVIGAAYRLCCEDLEAIYGAPLLEDGKPSDMTVCALGKCGGRELGFASDIELMFIYAGNGKTGGPQVISTTEFYEKLVTAFVRAIRARREGIFEVDLQLRPYGKAGSLSVSLDSFKRYFSPEGAAWAYERQALVKLRPVAGNLDLGRAVMKLRDEFVYTGQPFDVTAMRAMRERQVRHLVAGGTYNLKFSPGGLVDVEYLVQGLQITHGKEHPNLRQPNTREAMAALAADGFLSPEDYTRLRKAHTFLRWMIDALRMVRGNARDITTPPVGSEEFAFLARRMPYGPDPARLHEALQAYTRDVQELNSRLLA